MGGAAVAAPAYRRDLEVPMQAMTKAVIFSAVQSVLTLATLGYLVKQQVFTTKPAHAASAAPGAAHPGSDGDGEARPSKNPHPAAAKKEEESHGSHTSAAPPEGAPSDAGAPPAGAASDGEHGAHRATPPGVANTPIAGKSAAEPAHEKGAPTSGDPGEVAVDLLAGNARFVNGVSSSHPWTRERQSVRAEQQPKAMILSCSDSRVPPELIFDQGLGDLFVVRTAGNVADPIAVGSLEYATEHLHSKVLIVLGHERCGAVTAAASGEKMPTRSLDAIVKRIAPSVAAANGWAKGPSLIHMAAEINVSRTADDLLTQSPVLRRAVAEGHLSILRAMYDLDSGKVTPLP